MLLIIIIIMFLFLEQQAADSALRMSSVAPTQCMPYLSDMWQALGMYLARAPALGVRRDVSSRGPKVHVARARVSTARQIFEFGACSSYAVRVTKQAYFSMCGVNWLVI